MFVLSSVLSELLCVERAERDMCIPPSPCLKHRRVDLRRPNFHPVRAKGAMYNKRALARWIVCPTKINPSLVKELGSSGEVTWIDTEHVARRMITMVVNLAQGSGIEDHLCLK